LPNASIASFFGLAVDFQGGQILQDDDYYYCMWQIRSFSSSFSH
jgi:hypothetical protein